LTQASFYTQKLVHTEAFTHRGFYIGKLLHREALPQSGFVTLQNRNVPRLFDIRAPFRAKGLRLTLENRNFTSVFNIQPSFCANGLHLAVKTTKLYLELHIYTSFVICAFAILHRILLTFMSCDISVGLHLNCINF